MYAYRRIPGTALRLAAAGWVTLSLSACAPSSIDEERASFAAPPATAARTVAEAQLSLVHSQAHYGLNLKAATAPRPAAYHGALHGAYRRWTQGEVRELPESFTRAGQ